MPTDDNSTPQLKIDDDSSFWVVWNPRGGPPRCKHASVDSAYAEAVRLSEKYPGRHYYLLKCVGYAMKGEPTLTQGQLARKLATTL